MSATRRQLKLGLGVCLALALADVAVLNLYLIPNAWPPESPPPKLALAAQPKVGQPQVKTPAPRPKVAKAQPKPKAPQPKVAKTPKPKAPPQPKIAKAPKPKAPPQPKVAKAPVAIAKAAKAPPQPKVVPKPAKPAQTTPTSPSAPVPLPPGVLAQATVFFAFNGYGVAVPMRRLLDREILRKVGKQRVDVRIEGHSDPLGERDYNRRLSKLRALNVRFYLLQQGLEVRRIVLRALGSTQASGGGNDARAQNRRVIVRVRKVRR